MNTDGDWPQMNADERRFGKARSVLSALICVNLRPVFLCIALGMPGRLLAAEDGYQRLIEADLQRFRPVDARGAEELRQSVGADFRIYHGAHFTLLSDTDEATAKAAAGAMEGVYQSFYTEAPAIGLRPLPPKDRLVCILFEKRDAFLEYLRKTDAAPAEWSTGSYSWRTNRCVLYHDLENPAFDDIRADGRGDVAARLAEVARITTLQKARHEVAHQLMYNSGLFSRGKEYPFWLDEGVAMLFEFSDERGDCSPHVVNALRLKTYRAAEKDGRLAPMEKLIATMGEPQTQQGKDTGEPPVLRGKATGRMPVPRSTRPAQRDEAEGVAEQYAQAWALAHFLWNKHPAELKAFVENLRGDELPAEATKVFRKHFGQELRGLEKRWREYMGSL